MSVDTPSQAVPIWQLRSGVPTVRTNEEPSLIGQSLLRQFGSGTTQTTALRDVSITLFPRELNVMMGPSGSGKSTLLAVLSALLRPTAGTVLAHGEDLWAKSDRELERFRLRH
ncbi:MAG: ATP-binding cassette domain-containing protein, partial [Bacteroidales bacterium]|nr:ATP-binding cassette domain-containing protein [Bacteroidales bacterium]